MLENLFAKAFHIFVGVEIGNEHWFDVEFLVMVVPFVVHVGLGDWILQLLSKSDASLICPAPSNILNGIAASSHHNHWNSKLEHVIDTIAMAFYTKVKVSKFIMAE